MNARYGIAEADPVTGSVSIVRQYHANGLTAVQVVGWLRVRTAFEPDKLAGYAVTGERSIAPAERWLEDHPGAHVIAAWQAGGPAARHVRQEQLREWWPDLALALDNMEANGGD